jgi:hypothetical protein
MKSLILFVMLGSCLSFGQTKPRTQPKVAPRATVNTSTLAGATVHSVTLGGCTDTTAGVMFNFYRGSIQGQESTTPLNASPLATCSYTDTGVMALGSYYYSVKAYCSTCNPSLSGPDEVGPVVIPADGQPATPTGLTVGTIAKNNVPLMWKAPIQQAGVVVDNYWIYRCGDSRCPSPPRVAIVPASQKSYTATCTPVAPNVKKTCWFDVKAHDTIAGVFVTSGPSNIVVATTTVVR